MTSCTGAALWFTEVASAELYRAALDEDLRPLSALLWKQRIAHRVAEEGGAQVITLADAEQIPAAVALRDRWLSGELKVSLVARERPSQAPAFAAALWRAPVTAALIVFGICGFLLLYVPGPVEWISALTFAPFTLPGGQPQFAPQGAELWRLVTPIFLHFGVLHITFNALWCWDLGRRIEAALGGPNLAGLVLVIAALSNSAQWQFSPGVLFGGLSGVVYGLLGFAWTAGRLNPHWQALMPASSIMLFMVGWLVICAVGVVDVLGFSIANAAHIAGLLSGVFLGALFALAHRARQ